MAQHNNRNSPHLSSHMNGSAPPSPSMSNAQQQGGQARQSVGYPSPTTSYPSPSTQYNYPNQQVSPPYLAFASRASSAGSSSSFLSLPSMRSIDPLHQQQHMGAPLPPVGPPMTAGYYGPPHPSQYQNVTSDPTGMRYALPATDARVMSGGRHKKEIKRRTKTGCLTCRKRRIKCDEQHPACRNCQKSKRECLGYDPVFKQQPGPAAIQPAPSSAPLQGGVSAMVNQNPYGHQPHMLSGYAGYDPSLSAAGSSASGSQQYDYSSAIDPALEAAAPPTPTTASNQFSQGNRTMNELLTAGGDAPPPSTIDVSQLPPKIEEIKHLYFSIYSPGLENFLESKWYSVKGVNKLLGDNVLLAQFAMLLDQFAKTGSNDPAEIKYTSSVEARTVWALATSVRAMTAGVKSSGLVPPVDDPVEATHRLAVFEALLTGQIAHHNTLTRPVAGSTDHHRLRELEFWYTLGNFITLPYESSTSAKDVDSTLASLRNLLDGRENRDVLYSIAVVRAIGHRVSEYTESDTPVHFDETDNRSKLAVAKKFIGDEASGNGTTNVIRRLCELAARSWAPKPASSPAKQD